MVVPHFLNWLSTARVAERAAAASALARAFIGRELSFDDHCSAEAALTLLLDDPAWQVRLALAEALSMSPLAPPQIIDALASDQPDVAAMVLARSPLLDDADLIDRVADGSDTTQRLIAGRPAVSAALSAAIAEVGCEAACLALVCNAGADIAATSFRRICDRFGASASLREALAADARLPSDCRHMLLGQVAQALGRSSFVTAILGERRAAKVARDAEVKSTLALVDHTAPQDYEPLVEQIRDGSDLTASFLLRVIAHGKIDFFSAALVSLTGQSSARVRAMLATGNDVALAALFSRAGLGAGIHGVMLCALKIWREVANGRRVAGVQEVSFLMLKHLGPRAEGELALLLKSVHLDALRENARWHAIQISAAPPVEFEPELGEQAEVVPLEPMVRAA